MSINDLRNLPLAALRAFECVGRHPHLGRAGEELGVTYSAVSHQIRNLELALGTKLFDRTQNRLRLTPAGRQLHQAVAAGFETILSGTRNVNADEFTGPLVIGCTQTIGACWALKRVCEFQSLYPNIEIAIKEIAPKQQRIPTEIDIAICYGSPDAQRRKVQPLLSPSLYPVCSPGLANSHGQISTPAALSAFRLLDDGQNSWRRWFDATGEEYPATTDTLHVGNTYLALSAAREGLGVALCNTLETEADFEKGALVRIINAPVPEAEDYYLAKRITRVQSPRVELFEHWLTSILKQTPAQTGSFERSA